MRTAFEQPFALFCVSGTHNRMNEAEILIEDIHELAKLKRLELGKAIAPSRVRISKARASRLKRLNVADWRAALGEFALESECNEITGKFFTEGGAAANGLEIFGGCFLVVGEFGPPEVEIIEFIQMNS